MAQSRPQQCTQIMKKYVLKPYGQRPLRFEGLAIASTDPREGNVITPLELIEHARKEADQTASYMILNLYKTRNNKIIQQRFDVAYDFDKDDFGAKRHEVLVFQNIEDYLSSIPAKIGWLTLSLVNNLIDNYPEYEDLWVQDID